MENELEFSDNVERVENWERKIEISGTSYTAKFLIQNNFQKEYFILKGTIAR